MELRDILQKIGESNRALLRYALESDLPQHVEYEPGRFVGVNVQAAPTLVVERSHGAYQTGAIRSEEKPDDLRAEVPGQEVRESVHELGH